MPVRSWRLAAILFVAFSLAPALAHLLEMPAKLAYDGRRWVTLQQSLYGPGFGTVVAALAALVSSVLVEIPGDPRRTSERTRAGVRAAPPAAPTR